MQASWHSLSSFQGKLLSAFQWTECKVVPGGNGDGPMSSSFWVQAKGWWHFQECLLTWHCWCCPVLGDVCARSHLCPKSKSPTSSLWAVVQSGAGEVLPSHSSEERWWDRTYFPLAPELQLRVLVYWEHLEAKNIKQKRSQNFLSLIFVLC